jgi:hypothetical protein
MLLLLSVEELSFVFPYRNITLNKGGIMSNPTEQEINANGCNQDMSHTCEYDISVPSHAPDYKAFMTYMVISWGIVIIGMFAISAII